MIGHLIEPDDQHLQPARRWRPGCPPPSARRRRTAAPRRRRWRPSSRAPGEVPAAAPAACSPSPISRAWVMSAIRRMNSSAASTTPTDTATTMSNTTVRTKQVTSTSTSLRGATRSTCAKCFGLGHVPGDQQQQRRQARHRQVADERRQGDDRGQHRQRVNDRRDRRAGARADVGGRARDGAGGRDAPEERGHDVSDPQRQQLGVGVVAGAGHAVGDHGRQQRLDSAQHGHRERARTAARAGRRTTGRAAHRPGPARATESWAAAAAAEPAAPRGRPRWFESGWRWWRPRGAGATWLITRGEDPGQRNGDQRRRNPLGQARNPRSSSKRRRRRRPARRATPSRAPATSAAIRSKKLVGIAGQPQAQHVLDLQVAMTVPMPAVKPVVTGCGMNSMSWPRRPRPMRDQDEAAHQPRDQQSGHPEAGIDRRQDHDEGGRGPGDLGPRSAQGRHHDPGHDGGVKAVLRRDPDGDAPAPWPAAARRRPPPFRPERLPAGRGACTPPSGPRAGRRRAGPSDRWWSAMPDSGFAPR